MGGMQTALTGRENVKFVCRIHGLRGEEMREKLRYVQTFADICWYWGGAWTSPRDYQHFSYNNE